MEGPLVQLTAYYTSSNLPSYLCLYYYIYCNDLHLKALKHTCNLFVVDKPMLFYDLVYCNSGFSHLFKYFYGLAIWMAGVIFILPLFRKVRIRTEVVFD
uniref:PDR_CDR domain-containing protein n=1 Tax=Bursaphelenchus xylophilus TaxID=6326 RepID=A0A1I7SRT9_BURXY